MRRMWGILKGHDFARTHGAIMGDDIEDVSLKGRVLESMKIQARHMRI